MARKLTPEELRRYSAVFDPPAWATDEQTAGKDSLKIEKLQEATPETKKDPLKNEEIQEETKPKRKGRGNPNGRPPSIDPRTKMVAFKLSAAERERLDEAARILDTTKTKIVVEGIDLVYSRALQEERRQQRKGVRE